MNKVLLSGDKVITVEEQKQLFAIYDTTLYIATLGS